MTTRKEIRDNAKARIKSVYTGSVHIGSESIQTEEQEFVAIHLKEGELVDEGLETQLRSELIVGIHAKGSGRHDRIDQIGTQIKSTLKIDRTLSQKVSGLVYQGWEYPDSEDKSYDNLLLRFSFTYEED